MAKIWKFCYEDSPKLTEIPHLTWLGLSEMSILLIAMYWVPALCQVPGRFIVYFREVNKWYNGDSILGLFGFQSWSFLTMPNTSKFRKATKQFADKSYTGFPTCLRHGHIRFGMGCWSHSQVLLQFSSLESVRLCTSPWWMCVTSTRHTPHWLPEMMPYDLHCVCNTDTHSLALVFTSRGSICFIIRIRIAG